MRRATRAVFVHMAFTMLGNRDVSPLISSAQPPRAPCCAGRRTRCAVWSDN
jgi:hypothetical protein